MKRAIWVLAAVLLACPGVFADSITLKNGDRLTGAIVRSDGKTLVLKTDTEGDVTLQWSAIDTVTSTQPLHVGFAGGQVAVGPVATKGGQVQVTTQTAGVVSASKDSVQFIRSDAEQTAYDGMMERLQHPHLGDFWTGTLDAGLTVTSGNSSTLSFSLAGKAVRQTDRDKVTVYVAEVYGKNDTTSPSAVIANQIAGGVRADINFNAKWFGFGATDFNSNALQHLDLGNVIYGGIGAHLVKTKDHQFDVFAGAGYNQEYFGAFTAANPTPPPATKAFAAVTQKNAVINVGEQYTGTVGRRSNFSETLNLFPNISGPSGYHLTFNTTFATTLNKWLAWQISLNDNYLSNPPNGLKGNDVLLSTGLRLTVGGPK